MSSTGTTISGRAPSCCPHRRSRTRVSGPTRNWAIRSSGRWVAERPIRCTLSAADQVLEALERQGEVGAALGLGDGVDLVDDHRLGAGEDLAGARGEHQVERLGRGDQDVGRRFPHRPPFRLARVAGPQADGDVGADPAQRGPQVALDVVGERLQRRDVDELARPSPGRGSRARRSIPQRKLASVLPEPVGAQISVWAPPEIAFQPPACAGVGPSKEASNQRRTGALNGASGSDSAVCFRLGGQPTDLTHLPRGAAQPAVSRRAAGDLRGAAQPALPPANFT